ncbi:MAG: lipoate--protein ligase family protein [Candidatus Promineifilaceae bacterium]
MALDEAIWQHASAGDERLTLRFYACQPACLSISLEQEWDVVDLARCRELGWDVTRRPTPGRAILHADDVAYACIIPAGHLLAAGGPAGAYPRLAEGLFAGLRALSLDPGRARPVYQDAGPQGAAAFDGPAEMDIAVGQRKLASNSAVRDEGGAILFQGSLLLAGEGGRIAEGLLFDWPGQRTALVVRLGYRATSLEKATGRPIAWEECVRALAHGLAAALEVEWQTDAPSRAETALAQQLTAGKYANLEWLKLR